MEVRSLTAARMILDDLTQSSKHRKKPKKKNTLIKLLKPICRRIVSLLVSLVFPRDSARRLDVFGGKQEEASPTPRKTVSLRGRIPANGSPSDLASAASYQKRF